MPQELQLQVSPQIAANENLLNEHVAQLVRVSTKLVHKVVILKRSIDARQKAVKVNLKVSVYLIDEKYIEECESRMNKENYIDTENSLNYSQPK